MVRVLFVCLGNICRSPMAEGVFRHLVAQRELSAHITTDSAGTSRYHIGEPPHHGTLQILHQNGIQLQHAARQFTRADAERFDLLVAMDSDNISDMQHVFPHGQAPEIHYLLDFIPDGPRGRGVPDPWYTGDFDAVYQLVAAACHGLLEHIVHEHL